MKEAYSGLCKFNRVLRVLKSDKEQRCFNMWSAYLCWPETPIAKIPTYTRVPMAHLRSLNT